MFWYTWLFNEFICMKFILQNSRFDLRTLLKVIGNSHDK